MKQPIMPAVKPSTSLCHAAATKRRTCLIFAFRDRIACNGLRRFSTFAQVATNTHMPPPASHILPYPTIPGLGPFVAVHPRLSRPLARPDTLCRAKQSHSHRAGPVPCYLTQGIPSPCENASAERPHAPHFALVQSLQHSRRAGDMPRVCKYDRHSPESLLLHSTISSKNPS